MFKHHCLQILDVIGNSVFMRFDFFQGHAEIGYLQCEYNIVSGQLDVTINNPTELYDELNASVGRLTCIHICEEDRWYCPEIAHEYRHYDLGFEYSKWHLLEFKCNWFIYYTPVHATSRQLSEFETRKYHAISGLFPDLLPMQCADCTLSDLMLAYHMFAVLFCVSSRYQVDAYERRLFQWFTTEQRLQFERIRLAFTTFLRRSRDTPNLTHTVWEQFDGMSFRYPVNPHRILEIVHSSSYVLSLIQK